MARLFYDSLIDTNTFDWNIFDYVFITERTNITDQMASLYRWNNPSQNYIDIQNKEFQSILNIQKNALQIFREIKNTVLNTHKSAFLVDYDCLTNHSIEELNNITRLDFTKEHFPRKRFQPKIDYKSYFINYKDLENLINNW